MEAHYGYDDASGSYFIVIDTDKCDGCTDCVTACPEGVLEVVPDDYDEMKARVKEAVVSRVGYVCPGFNPGCSTREPNCRSVCRGGAISHTW